MYHAVMKFIKKLKMAVKLKKPDSIFGVKTKTKGQKRFMRYFIIIKSAVYVVIFILVLVFLRKLKNFGK